MVGQHQDGDVKENDRECEAVAGGAKGGRLMVLLVS